MSRQNHHAWIIHADKHHEYVVCWVIVADRFCRQFLISVIAGGFIPMMPIRDENRFGTEAGGDFRKNLGIGDGPEVVDDTQVICHFKRRCSGNRGFELLLGIVGFIRINPENLAQIVFASTEEFEAICFGCRVGFFMRKDIPLPKLLQLAPSHESATGVSLTCECEGLMVDIDGGVRFFKENALLLPRIQELRCARVTRILFVPGFISIQNESNDVCGMFFIEVILHLSIDDIVRRCNHICERSHMTEIITNTSECLDVGHNSLVPSKC